MQQRDVAERLEGQEFGLCDPLLRQRAGPAARDDRRRRGRDLQQLAARQHWPR
jgi:hypothetical protein